MVKEQVADRSCQKSEFYPIREVSRITGVNAVTLRAWERRYGLITPLRTEKGHRVYSTSHIEQIRAITSWINRGVPVGKVKSLLQQTSDTTTELAEESEQEWRAYQTELMRAVSHYDEPKIDSVYSSALKIYPVEIVTERLVKPVYELVSRVQVNDNCRLNAEQQFLISCLRGSIHARVYHAARNNKGPRILCASCPEENDELDTLLLAVSVCDSEGRAVLLPPGVSLLDIGAIARNSGCDAVLLHSNRALHKDSLEKSLPRMIRASDCQITISGHCTSIHREELKRIGVHLLENNRGCSAREILGACKI